MNCPKCGVVIDTTDLARSLASKGGKAGRGRAKARTTEQAQAAARVRWNKARSKDVPFSHLTTDDKSPCGDPCHDNFDID